MYAHRIPLVLFLAVGTFGCSQDVSAQSERPVDPRVQAMGAMSFRPDLPEGERLTSHQQEAYFETLTAALGVLTTESKDAEKLKTLLSIDRSGQFDDAIGTGQLLSTVALAWMVRNEIPIGDGGDVVAALLRSNIAKGAGDYGLIVDAYLHLEPHLGDAEAADLRTSISAGYAEFGDAPCEECRVAERAGGLVSDRGAMLGRLSPEMRARVEQTLDSRTRAQRLIAGW